MFDTIIVGVDGHDGGTDALQLAQRLGHATSRIVAVGVAMAPSERQDVLGALNRLNRAFYREAIVAPSVAQGLHATTHDYDADLIVVGSSRRGALGRILAGDDAAATMHDAPCPVAIAPRGYARTDAPLCVIGVGYDAGQEADAALAIAQRLAENKNAWLRAMHVVRRDTFPSTPEMIAAETADARARLQRIGWLEATVTVGLPIDRLRDFSGEVDLLVIGSRNRGVLARVTLGSTSADLARHARGPLLVVPRSAVGDGAPLAAAGQRPALPGAG